MDCNTPTTLLSSSRTIPLLSKHAYNKITFRDRSFFTFVLMYGVFFQIMSRFFRRCHHLNIVGMYVYMVLLAKSELIYADNWKYAAACAIF